MIWESHPWRDELCRMADKLERWSVAVDWESDDIAFEMERDVMVSAYPIRKLLEARKLADSTVATRLSVEAFPLVDRVPDLMNWHRLDELYDFDAASETKLTVLELCNQLIHSFIFMPEGDFDEDDATADAAGIAGFLVASDRARSSRLYRIGIDVLISLLRLVGTEDIASTQMTRDSSGQWQVSNLTATERDDVEPGWRDAVEAIRAEASARGQKAGPLAVGRQAEGESAPLDS